MKPRQAAARAVSSPRLYRLSTTREFAKRWRIDIGDEAFDGGVDDLGCRRRAYYAKARRHPRVALSRPQRCRQSQRIMPRRADNSASTQVNCGQRPLIGRTASLDTVHGPRRER
jgi:hypothetical protein